MNANIMKTQIFHSIKYDLRGSDVIKGLKNYFKIIFFNPNLRSYGQRLFFFSPRIKNGVYK